MNRDERQIKWLNVWRKSEFNVDDGDDNDNDDDNDIDDDKGIDNDSAVMIWTSTLFSRPKMTRTKDIISWQEDVISLTWVPLSKQKHGKTNKMAFKSEATDFSFFIHFEIDKK